MSSAPVQGSQYVVVPGDNLSDIAGAAYGDKSKWRIIWNANRTKLKSGNPNVIFPGEVLTIPIDQDTESLKQGLRGTMLAGKDPDDFTLTIDGTEIPVFSGRLIRTMDTMANGWIASLAWNTSDRDISDLLKPYKYHPCKIYLGGLSVCDSVLYTVTNTIGRDGRTKTLAGFSPTADLVDSTFKPPYEFQKMNLETIAKTIIEPFGIPVVYELDDDEEFKKVTAQSTQTVFDFLVDLTRQRGGLLSSTRDGEALFWKANSGLTRVPVGVIKEGQPPASDWNIEFDGRKRFSNYVAQGKNPGRKKQPKTAIALDNKVTRVRMLTFQSDETGDYDIQSAADWKRSKQVADSLTIPFPVSSWYAPNGDLWEENTIVTVESETMEVPDGFDFLISSVEYEFGKDGTPATLNLIPPEAYSGEEIYEPW